MSLLARAFFRKSLLPVLAAALGACGGNVAVAPAADASSEASATEAGLDAGADSGPCPEAGSYPVECNGVLLYCCPPGAHCDPPSCSQQAADAAAPADTGPCPSDEYLLTPCCGGFNDMSCSNGPSPPPPFCTAIPASCAGKSVCTVGGCEGTLDTTNRTLGCNCI
jgi:hypothetical protein